MTPERPLVERLRFRGANRALLYNPAHEVILCGAADTGKTVAACYKSTVLASQVDGVHAAIVRKTYNSLHTSVLRTFERVTAGMGIRKYGGERVESYLFPNGSKIIPVGMDNPDKLLSSEWDFVQVCQSEELTQAQWEMIASRCTGRSAKVPHPQIFGDCNPSSRMHWIRRRNETVNEHGQPTLDLLNGRHQDNPELYDDAGNILPEGERRLATLSATLTGVRRRRLLFNEWATAEGAVYDNFDSTAGGEHVKERNPAEMVEWYLCQDDGYTDPAVILLVGSDSDRRWHVFQEFYAAGNTHKQVANIAQEWAKAFNVTADAVDGAAASLIAELRDRGINAVGAKANVEDTCNLIRDRLQIAGDGLPRLTFDKSCVNTINDMESYAFKPGTDKPAHENSHACDALRYLAIHLSEPTASTPGVFFNQRMAGARSYRRDRTVTL